MSFQMPGDNASVTPGAPSSGPKLSTGRIGVAVAGAALIVVGVILWITGDPLGSSGDQHGAGFADTFPDYGRLLLILIGAVLISMGLFKKKKEV